MGWGNETLAAAAPVGGLLRCGSRRSDSLINRLFVSRCATSLLCTINKQLSQRSAPEFQSSQIVSGKPGKIVCNNKNNNNNNVFTLCWFLFVNMFHVRSGCSRWCLRLNEFRWSCSNCFFRQSQRAHLLQIWFWPIRTFLLADPNYACSIQFPWQIST